MDEKFRDRRKNSRFFTGHTMVADNRKRLYQFAYRMTHEADPDRFAVYNDYSMFDEPKARLRRVWSPFVQRYSDTWSWLQATGI